MPAHKKLSQNLFLSVVVATLALGIAPAVTPSLSSVLAVNNMVITAIPPKLELKGDPGQTLTATLKVRNDTTETQNYAITVEDFVVVDNQGTPVPVAAKTSNRWSLQNWVKAPESVPVDAGDVQTINVTVKIPLTALPGGHYAMVTYTPNADVKSGDLKTTGNVVTQRVGTLLYVTVSGPITEKANITKFSAPDFTEQGPVNFTGTVESLSDSHVNPKGNITIYSPINTKVTEISVDTGNVFPETSRDFTATWNQKWGWGRYRADLNLVYGATGAIITASAFFWFFPIRLVIYILTALIAVLTIILILNKRSKKHQEELEKEVQELKQELENVENQETK